MRQRLYIDTSVIGGYFDKEFEEISKLLFERIRQGEFLFLYSTVTEDELEGAPENVKKLILNLPSDSYEFIEMTEEAVELALTYINEKVVGKSSLNDCLHIALATVNHADYLVSWNFKHIVNVDKIRGYNSVNIKLGYRFLDIRSPREFIRYEN